MNTVHNLSFCILMYFDTNFLTFTRFFDHVSFPNSIILKWYKYSKQDTRRVYSNFHKSYKNVEKIMQFLYWAWLALSMK